LAKKEANRELYALISMVSVEPIYAAYTHAKENR
jgi:hypothetical protein